MARYRGPACRLCRRENTKLFLKGTRCMSDKCTLIKRAFSPGQHGRKRTKLSDYGLQLREKQKVRRMYGISERQFRLYFKKAEASKGVTGTVLLQFLERRLDRVILNLGFATSHSHARQLVKHGFVLVNFKIASIPSYLIKEKDVISIKENEEKTKLIREIIKMTKKRTLPQWLSIEAQKLQGTVIRLPERADIQLPVKEQLIVELYSK